MSSTPLIPAPLPPDRARSTWWSDRRFWLGAGISIVCLWLAFRNVHWAELARAIQAVDWAILALAALVALLDQFVRGRRWRVLLTPVGKVSVADSFSFLSIGALANSVLPLRAGEIIRAVLLGEKSGLSKSAVFATVVVERLFDVLMLVALTLILLTAMPIPALVKGTAVAFGLAGLVALLVMWWAVGQLAQNSDGRLIAWAKRTVPRLAGPQERPRRVFGVGLPELFRKGWLIVHSFVGGLGVVRSPRLAAGAALYTALAWAASLVYIWLVLRACHLQLPWMASLMVLVIINFGAAVPSSPGGLGVVHVLAILALTPWNVEPSQALTFAIMVHAVVLAVVVMVGLVCLWREGIGLSQLARSGDQPTTVVSAEQEMTP